MKLKDKIVMDTAAGHITPIGGNVFADLGFDAAQAKELQEQSRRVIAKKLAIKTATDGHLSCVDGCREANPNQGSKLDRVYRDPVYRT